MWTPDDQDSLLLGPFHSLWNQVYIQRLVLWSLWRSRPVIPELLSLFCEPGMVLVTDCEVKTSPFISMPSSTWQPPADGCLQRSLRGHLEELCWLLLVTVTHQYQQYPPVPASKQQGVANLQDSKDWFFLWMLQPSTWHLSYTEQWEWCCEGIS